MQVPFWDGPAYSWLLIPGPQKRKGQEIVEFVSGGSSGNNATGEQDLMFDNGCEVVV